jgi:hypothetical protein
LELNLNGVWYKPGAADFAAKFDVQWVTDQFSGIQTERASASFGTTSNTGDYKDVGDLAAQLAPPIDSLWARNEMMIPGQGGYSTLQYCGGMRITVK